MTAPVVQLVRLHPLRDADLPLPAYQTSGAAGADLCAAIAEPLMLQPLQRVLVPTGLALAIPPGFEGQVRPRSGIAVKRGLTVPNAPGTIDAARYLPRSSQATLGLRSAAAATAALVSASARTADSSSPRAATGTSGRHSPAR